jgi:rhodanese-related sulfurtransferase
MYKTVTPAEAKELVDEGYTYVDVRSVGEFDEGHPEGAANVPLLHAGMVPNERFLEVMEANYPKDARLVVGCKSGGRSARAAEMLTSAGYTDVVNMDGGFHGRYGPAGNLVQEGWEQAGFPVSTEDDESMSYEGLEKRADEK